MQSLILFTSFKTYTSTKAVLSVSFSLKWTFWNTFFCGTNFQRCRQCNVFYVTRIFRFSISYLSLAKTSFFAQQKNRNSFLIFFSKANRAISQSCTTHLWMTWSFVWSGSQQILRFYFSRDFSFWCESGENQIKERVSYYALIKWSYPDLWYNREKTAETQLLNLWENKVEKFIWCKYWVIDSGVRKKWEN